MFRYLSYVKTLNDFENSNILSNEILYRPRLMTFEKIVKSNSNLVNYREQLFQDFKDLRLHIINNQAYINNISNNFDEFNDSKQIYYCRPRFQSM